MDKTIISKMDAINAARGQEALLIQHRDFMREKRDLERKVEEYKLVLVEIESQLDFSATVEEEDNKATGRLRLPDNSYQLTKTVFVTVKVDEKKAMADERVRKMLDTYIELVPVLKTKEALADEKARKILLPFTTQTDSIRITSTFEPK